MGRVIFRRSGQIGWIHKVVKNSNLSSRELAEIIGVHPRTFRDWKRGKITMSEKALSIFNKMFNVPIPSDIEIVSDYWYVVKGAKIGGLKRTQMYGAPGTLEGRRKGGQTSQLRRRQYPELYSNCNLRKEFVKPGFSENLAEMIGIILGDGGVSCEQLQITLNKCTEPEYIDFVSGLMDKVFGEKPKKYFVGGVSSKACDLIISGVGLVEILSQLGIQKGNKVAKQVGVPNWIRFNPDYARKCLRGLIDTDGCVFSHRHRLRGYFCLNLGLTFTSHSQPLLDFVFETLENEGFNPKLQGDGIYLYRATEVIKYTRKIGFSNTHHLNRFNQFFEHKLNMVRCESGLIDRLGESA